MLAETRRRRHVALHTPDVHFCTLARAKLGYSRMRVRQDAGVDMRHLQAIEMGLMSPAESRERVGRVLTGDPRALLTRPEADARAAAAGLSREDGIEATPEHPAPPPLARSAYSPGRP